jgi:protein phosphatase PTC7
VADGVGGWAEMGVDSGLYSRELCQNVKTTYQSNPKIFDDDPKQLVI